MDKDFKIKEIEENRIDEVIEVIHKSFETEVQKYGLTKENAKGNSAFIDKGKLIKDKRRGNLMYGLFKDEVLLGFMQLRMKDNTSYILENLSVTPNIRNLGYGSILVNYAKEKVRVLGGKKLSLGCIYENTSLLNFYIKNGFVFREKKAFKKYPYTVGFFDYIYNK